MSWIFRFLEFFLSSDVISGFLLWNFHPTHPCIHTHTHTHAHARSLARTHAQTHTHTCHTNTHMRTHTQQTAVNAETHNILFSFLSIILCFSCSICTEKIGPLPQYGSFPKYWQNVSWIFPHHGKHSLTMELDKTIESGFSNLFLQYFHTMKRSNISSAVVQWLRGWHVTQYETSAFFADLECGVHV